MPQYRTIPANSSCHSDVAAACERVLCVTVMELEGCHVDINTLKRGLHRQRSGAAYCWPHHKEGRSIYIHYDGMQDRYKVLIDNIYCEGVAAPMWIANKEAAKRQANLRAICRNVASMVEVSPGDLETLQGSGFFDGSAVQCVARAAGWLRLWRSLDVKRARSMGFSSVTEIQEALYGACMKEQADGFVKFPKPVNSIRVLDRKAREFDRGGMDSLIGGYFGNGNRGKIDTLIHAVLMNLAASPLKYSFEDIAMMYNTDEQWSHLERLTTSAIKEHLNQPKNKKVWSYARHGKLVGDDLYQPQALRDTPEHPDDLWSIDGTSAQLYYLDSNGKIRSDLYVYFVADAATGAIIGKAVAYSETTGLVVEALQDAITTHGYAPHQLQYDNSSANVSAVAKGLYNNMAQVSFSCQPYLGRAKYIEEIIGHFQQRVLRKYKNFKGSNITARSLGGKANPELLKWLKNNPSELPNESQAIEQILEAVTEWNSRGERRDNYGRWVGESKIARYEVKAEGRKPLNYFEKLSLFMVELPKPYKYKQQGIAITIGGKKHNYIVPDAGNSAHDFVFSDSNMYKEFRVRVNVIDPQFIQLLDDKGRPVATAVEKERFAAAVANMKPGDGAAVKRFILAQKEYGYNYAMRELQTQRKVLNAHGLRATGTDGFFGDLENEGFGWQDSTKTDFNRYENHVEDQYNGLEPRESAASRRVFNALDVLNRM